MDFLTFKDRFARVSIVKYGDVYKFIYHKFNSERSGFRLCDDSYYDKDNNTNDTKLSNNISRARGRVFELAMCNEWQYFCTLTLNEDNIDRYNLNLAVKRFGEWVGNYNKKYHTKLKYLLVPEQHKDGAWHFHGLLNNISSDSLVKNMYGYLDLPFFVKRFGFISLSPIRDHNRTANYITKYVTKTMTATSVELNKHLFYASRGLDGAVKIKDGFMDSKLAHDLCDYENDYCGIAYIGENILQRVQDIVY